LSQPKPEKRGSQRVKLQIKVPVRTEANPGIEEATTRDISLYGVFLYMDSQVAQGAELEALLPIPSALHQEPDRWVRCRCRVVRVEELSDTGEFGVAATIEESQAVPQAITDGL
jgi:hypothetical protein